MGAPSLQLDDAGDDGGGTVGPVWTVVVGGGSGDRFGAPKQYQLLGGRRVIDLACDAARLTSDGVVVVLPASDVAAWRPSSTIPEVAVAGGTTRSESVRAGLAAVAPDASVICVHDAARPLATAELFSRVVTAVRDGAAGAVPAVPVNDTIKVVDHSGVVVDTPDRSTLVAVQTPQAFAADVLRRAHSSGADGTDDAALVERVGARVVVVPGEPWNRKITAPDDLLWAQSWLDRNVEGEREVAR